VHKSKTDRYKITNEDLFTYVSPCSQEWLNYTNSKHIPGSNIFQLDVETRKTVQARFERELIAEPLITWLKFLVSKGADKAAKVDKLEFYRKLDKHK
jgi:hypothetical protein